MLPFLLDEIHGSSGTLSGDYDPPVKQIILSKFIIGHGYAPVLLAKNLILILLGWMALREM